MAITSLKGSKVLIVEDEILVALACEAYLSGVGADVVVAHTLADSHEVYGASAFDAVVLDLRLPDGNGESFARKVLDDAVGLVIHSGHAQSGSDSGFEGACFCPKPSLGSEIEAALLQAIDKPRSE